MRQRRISGVLLPVTALPSGFGIGDLGSDAYRFVDFLAEAGQGIWQVLPLNATDLAHGHAPYSSASAFAGNPLLCAMDRLPFAKIDYAPHDTPKHGPVDYGDVDRRKYEALRLYWDDLGRRHIGSELYRDFCERQAWWLDDFALFRALQQHTGQPDWSEWPEALRDRHPGEMARLRRELDNTISRCKWWQYCFERQWQALQDYCHCRGVRLIGDIPIYVSYGSADVWAHPELFQLDHRRKPVALAGVPPDYFSATGQLWGNPVYDWDAMRERGFEWWVRRLERMYELYDMVRIDHFRGFIAYWETPAGETTALRGAWRAVPTDAFFRAIRRRFPAQMLIAEDLGVITPDVRLVMRDIGVPGMKVFLFGFGDNFGYNEHLPHTYDENVVAYTSTHDTNTLRGWFERETDQTMRERLRRYLGTDLEEREFAWRCIRLVMLSKASMVIVPMQDILGLGSDSRINCPSTSQGNWQWRLAPDYAGKQLAARLFDLTEAYGRR
jgi:4-alpha-glucanotransferase